MSTAHQLARALGAKRSGRQWVCRCPAHDDHEPSLIFWDGHSAIRFKCFSGCEPLDIIAALRRRGLLNGFSVQHDKPSTDRERRKRDDDDLARRHAELARGIWHAARDPRGTLVEDYLRSRGLVLDAALAGRVLRFHPRCPYRGEFLPALIAVFRSLDDNITTAIHRIRLDQGERWPKAERMMLGPVGRAAIKLDNEVGDTLAIGEGVETCLAARELGIRPTWALGSAGAIERFPVLPSIRTLRILAENDSANEAAREQCGLRWLNAGRRVRVIKPTADCKDLNDLLGGCAP
jgi:hypothetical protein